MFLTSIPYIMFFLYSSHQMPESFIRFLPLGSLKQKSTHFLSSVMRAVRPAHRLVFRSVDVHRIVYLSRTARGCAGGQPAVVRASSVARCWMLEAIGPKAHTHSRTELSLDKNRSWRKRWQKNKEESAINRVSSADRARAIWLRR